MDFQPAEHFEQLHVQKEVSDKGGSGQPDFFLACVQTVLHVSQ